MSNRQCTLAKVISEQCGQMIITSDPNDINKYIDITSEYNIQSSTITTATNPTVYPYPSPSKDCSIQIACSRTDVSNDFTITITLTNNGPMVRTIDGQIVIIAGQYNGDNPKSLLCTEFSGKITPNRGKHYNNKESITAVDSLD